MMKIKLLTLTAIVAGILAISSVANAATCEGGSLFTGVNDHEYCASNSEMNLWSAYTWCEANGRHLVTIYEACPEWDGAIGGKCKNLTSSFPYRIWSTTAYQANQVVCVESRSDVITINRNTANIVNALCY